MEETTIASEARKVVDLFELLGSVNPVTDDPSTPCLTEIEDQRGRFNIFARSVGVFAEGHASLDHRLRESEDAQGVTQRLLRTLQYFLKRTIQTADASEVGLQASLLLPSSNNNIDDSYSSSYVSSETSAASTASTQDTLELSETTAATEHMNGIEETIDRLYRLSWLIRTPSTASRNAKAMTFKMMDDDGKDCEQAFEQYAARVVNHRCPNASPELVAKMAKSILMRRKRFLYRRHHQAKLNFAPSDPPPISGGGGGPHAASTITSGIVTQVDKHTVQPSASQVTRFKGIPPSATSASAFSKTRFRPEAVFEGQSVISTAIFSPNDRADAFQAPPPPRVAPGSKEFECPYCYMMMPIKEAKAAAWKSHFLKDLDPFVCIFPDCPEPELMFSEGNAWLRHLQWVHARRWCCSAQSHPKQLFSSEHEYADHLRTAHKGAFAENHLPMLKRRAEVPGVAFIKCPFCPADPGVSNSGTVSDELLRHIAGHLRSLAMISLPPEDNDNDLEDEETASQKANESNVAEEDEQFEDLSSLSAHEDEDTLGRRTESVLRLDDTALGEPDTRVQFLDEWDFIDLPPYQGHDRDPTLQTFMRKLYLESSPTITITKGPNLPCWVTPFERNPDFFGRDYALAKAAEALVPSVIASNPSSADKPTNPRTFVIYGPGGMGKTQVAVEFVHRHYSEFDAVLWSHADDSSKLAQDFNAMARRLGLVAEDSVDARDQAYTRELVRRWLVDPLKDLQDKGSARASWLLIYDAVEEPEILNDFWPYDGPGSILITSRNPFTWTNTLQLNPFTVGEATNYLLKLTGRDCDVEGRAEVQGVSQRLGGLPLALTQMAGIITHRRMSFAEFVHAYNERESRYQMLHATPTQAVRTPWYEHSLASVWALESLRHGSTLLNTCSMFDPDGISERLFTENLGKVAIAGLPTTLAEYHQAKAELLGSSIITSERGSGKLCLHRLVQDVARMRQSPMQFRETFKACVQLVSGLWPFEDFTWRHGVGRWSICEELFPHILRLRELAEQHQLFPSSDDLVGDFVFARLLTDAGFYHHERGRSAEAWWFNDAAEGICNVWLERYTALPQQTEETRATVGRLNAHLAELLHNRGCISTETNRSRLAYKYFKDFHAQMMTEFDAAPELVTTDMRLGISWNELGNAHMLNRRWQEGEACFKRSIETTRRLTKFRPKDISLPLVNLGLAFWLQNRYDEALEVLTKGLKDRQEAFGPDDRISFITGRYLQALGNVMGSTNRREESLDYHRKALFHYKSTLGNGHHRTADLFTKVAEHSLLMNQAENALALLDHALKAYSDRDSRDRESAYVPEKARALFLKSRVLRIMRKEVEADVALEEAAGLLEAMLETGDKLDPESLTDKDFDEYVAFWSK